MWLYGHCFLCLPEWVKKKKISAYTVGAIFQKFSLRVYLIAQNASENILPEKSKSRYISTYDEFIAWREEKKANSFSENVMLAYFSELSAKLKPSTLWSRFSMIKSLKIRNNVDISEYPKLNAFLKRQSDGFTSKKSKILTSDKVEKSSPSPSHVEENVRPSTSVDNDNSSGQIPSTSKRHCFVSNSKYMQPKTSPVSIKNCSNFNVYVNYNFYKK
ncbi:hypothetical protein ABMA28_007261 [Loxostege sticticalis]|uniref:Uncharacterized protein n=1 Tax=Loxostege sticticalis TaxID=481309 RepID=A0ABD0TQ97_LOXSC